MEGEERNALNILVIWRGKKLNVEIGSGDTLKEFGHKLQKLTNVKADTMRLLVPRNEGSKLFTPFSDEYSNLTLQEASILEGKPIRMMGVFEEEVEDIKRNAAADLRIAGFDEEEKRLRQRMFDRPQASLKLPQGTYIFCDFLTLQIPGIKLDPPASEALRRMHMLAADPGIIAIMNKHRWRVGIMTEMAPEGYVGISPKCILGYNKNHGEEISLRLRTDDLKGFRKYESIKKTLLHELAHMKFSEHDADFYALDKQLNEEAASLDWTRSRSHTLSGERPSGHHGGEFYAVSSGNTSQRLGGKMSDKLASARASSVAAAYSRFAIASTSSSEGFEENVELYPNNSGLIVHELGHNDLAVKESMQIDNPNEADPKFEPDPDDSQAGKVVESEFLIRTRAMGITAEPDPDDCEVVQHASDLGINGKFLSSNCYEEPDPDDSELNGNASKCGVPVEQSMDDAEGNGTLDNGMHHKSSFEEPDPDDCEVVQHVSDLGINGKFLSPNSYEEPDPDDSELNGNTSKCGVPVEQNMDDAGGNGTSDNGMHHKSSFEEPDPDDSEITNSILDYGNGIKNVDIQPRKTAEEPDPDALGACLECESRRKPDPNVSAGNGITQCEPDPDDSVENFMGCSRMQVDELNSDNQELQRIQDPVSVLCTRLQKVVETLRSEVNPTEATSVLQTLFKIIKNVIEHPDEMKFRRLRKANPLFQRNVANYRAAMEVLFLVGFIEDVISDEVGRAETFIVLKRNDPGLLWLAKSSLEMCFAC